MSNRLIQFYLRSAKYGAMGFYTYGVHDNLQHYKYEYASVSYRTLKILGLSLSLGIIGTVWPVTLPIVCYIHIKDNKLSFHSI